MRPFGVWSISALALLAGCGGDPGVEGQEPISTDPGGGRLTADDLAVGKRPPPPGATSSMCYQSSDCTSGICLTKRFHPDFAGGYCSQLCNRDEFLPCGRDGACVPAGVDICVRSCEADTGCRDGHICLGKMCVPASVAVNYANVALVPEGQAKLERIIKAVNVGRLAIDVRMLSGAGPIEVVKPVEPSLVDLLGPPKSDLPGLGDFTPDPGNTPADLLAIQSRAVGTIGHEMAKNYIAAQLEKMGLQVEEQAFYHRVAAEPAGPDVYPSLRLVRLVNLRARLTGTLPAIKPVVVGAHYDSLAFKGQNAPGAADNASGVAAVLELARILTESGTPLRRTVEFVLFDAGMPGWSGTWLDARVGARFWADALAAEEKPFCMLNVDTIGMVNGASTQAWLGLDIKHSFAGEMAVEAIREYVRDFSMETTRANAFFTRSDHLALMNRGLCAGYLYDWPPRASLLTQYDTVEGIDWAKYAQAVQAAAAIVGAWADHRTLILPSPPE